MPQLDYGTITSLGLNYVEDIIEKFNEEQSIIFQQYLNWVNKIATSKMQFYFFVKQMEYNLNEATELYTKQDIDAFYKFDSRIGETMATAATKNKIKNMVITTDIQVSIQVLDYIHQLASKEIRSNYCQCKHEESQADWVFRFYDVTNFELPKLFKEIQYFHYGVSFLINYLDISKGYLFLPFEKPYPVKTFEKIADKSYKIIFTNETHSAKLIQNEDGLIVYFYDKNEILERKVGYYVYNESSSHSIILRRTWKHKTKASISIDATESIDEVILSTRTMSNNFISILNVIYSNATNKPIAYEGYSIIGTIELPTLIKQDILKKIFQKFDN